MKVASFNPVVYEVCYMDKERKKRTVEEEKLRKEADTGTSDIPGVIFEHFLGMSKKLNRFFFTSPFSFLFLLIYYFRYLSI